MTTPDPNRPAAPQPDREEAIAQRIGIGQLCAGIINGLGIDPEKVSGVRLTAQGGSIPELVVWHLPPMADMQDATDEWVTGLANATRGTTYAVLPGQDAQAPAARDRGPMGQVPEEVELEATLARILPMLAEVINGAYVDGDTRDWLTATAHHAAEQAQRRVAHHIFAASGAVTFAPMPEPPA